MRATEQRAVQAYRDQFHDEPVTTASSPGRVNLIGEHTDYNEGFVLPCAIDRRVAVAMGNGTRGLYSADYREERKAGGCREGSWADYPRAVAWALADAGHEVPRIQATFAGDVPLAAGLSSSAAVEGAIALALNECGQLGLSKLDLAILCRRAENGFIGVNSGIMDQYASLLCTAGHALLIDCRSLEARSVPLALEPAGLSLVVCNTRVERRLGSTGYNDRRAACERAAKSLGVTSLRDATLADLDRLDGDDLRRARHVVTENARVLAAVDALERNDFHTFGELMFSSHESLRDDYEVSVPQLDLFVDVARRAGAMGARLTGAGFGGCAIALAPLRSVDRLTAMVNDEFADREFDQPELYTFQPSDGGDVAR